MQTLSTQFKGGHLRLMGLGLLSAVLVACGGNSTPSSSSSAALSSKSSSTIAITSSSRSSTAISSSSRSSVASSTGVAYDHCIDGFKPHPTNGLITDGGSVHTRSNQKDVSVDPNVYDYMYKNGWQDAHVLWHQARTCSGPGGAGINGLPSACRSTELLPKQNDCQGAINGMDFFSGHRVMMEQLQQLWPNHKQQFTGWGKFPLNKSDYPPELQGYYTAWSPKIVELANIGDNIDKPENLAKFPTEGDLGTWISCAIMPGAAGGANFSTQSNLHFALHNNGVPTQNQKHAVNNNNVNIDSFLFWKLHGWIDGVWEKYRIAKGKKRTDADYKAEMLEQCREMDGWRKIGVATRGTSGHPNEETTFVPVPVNEVGFFHEKVRPAIEKACSTCHGAGESGGLRLGYEITSTEIVEKLLNRSSTYAKNYKVVVPGDPDKSWLYLKASGKSVSSGVTCQGIADCAKEMPGLSAQELQYLYDWIKNGAELPVIAN